MLASLLLLWSATATLGALLFFWIILNIFAITLSFDFNYTPVVTALMLVATLYLLLWDYHRLRSIFGYSEEAESALALLPLHRLSGIVERGAYVAGVLAGFGFFSGTRGMFFPWAWNFWFLLGCLLSFVVALWCGLRGRRGGNCGNRFPG